MDAIWTELETFLVKYQGQYDLSFSIQYSSVIDWVAGITPRKNHPQARQYDVWQGQATNPIEALRRTIDIAQAEINRLADEA